MDWNDTATRRRTLALSAALVAGTAGCTDDSEEGGTEDGAGGMDEGGNDTTGGQVDEEDAPDDTEEPANETDTEDTGGQADVRGEIPTEPSDDVSVQMETEEEEYYFDPEVTWVNPGSTVTFVNASGSHSSTAYAEENDQPQRIPDDAEGWDSGILSEEGGEFEHTFETEGVYDYYCIPHETMGMLGTVIVGEPDPEGQPGLEEPGDEFDDAVAEKLSALNQAAEDALGGGGDGGGTENETDTTGNETDTTENETDTTENETA